MKAASRPSPARFPLRHPGGIGLLAATLLSLLLPAPAASARETHVLDIYHGSARSDQVNSVSSGSYELSGGEVVRFDDWYSPVIPDLTFLMLTEVSQNFGIIWGLSTGESGQKYRIDPALHLGFTWRVPLSERATLSTSLTTVLGGRLRESSCNADYGTFGMAEVNCRLAASILAPEETLDYLLDEPGWKESRITIRFELRF